jgi:hypothetical protein
MTEQTKPSTFFKAAFREQQKAIFTCIPGHILTFDPTRQMAQVQIGVQRVDINDATFTPPPIIEVPVQFSGGDWHLEFELNPGDEGMIHFAQRCVDGWIQTGGVAANPIARFHNPQDAFFAPGYRSQPNKLPAFQNNGIRLASRDGSQFAWLKNDGTVSVENPAGHIRIAVDGTVTINGATITPGGDVITAAGISLDNHRTSGVTPGSGISSVPVT